MAGRAAFCCHLIDGNTHGRLGHREWRLRCRGASLHFTDIPGIFVASSYVVVVLRRRFNIWDRATSSWFFQTIFRAIPHSTKIDTHTYIRDGRKSVLEWLSLSLLFSFQGGGYGVVLLIAPQAFTQASTETNIHPSIQHSYGSRLLGCNAMGMIHWV